MWLAELDFLDVINHEWNIEFSENPSRRFVLKLKSLKALKAWNRNSALSLKMVLEECKGKIRALNLLEET